MIRPADQIAQRTQADIAAAAALTATTNAQADAIKAAAAATERLSRAEQIRQSAQGAALASAERAAFDARADAAQAQALVEAANTGVANAQFNQNAAWNALTEAKKPENRKVTLDVALASAVALQRVYGERYLEAGKIEDVLQLPVIGAAALAANTVLNGTKADAVSADTARDLGRIGIGIGAFTAVRGALMPKGLAGIYADGYFATGCILALGTEMTVAAEGFDEFEGRRVALAAKIARVEGFVAGIPANLLPKMPAELKLAELELANARKVQLAAGLQAAAFARKESAFEAAVYAVAQRVVARALVRQQPDYASLRDSLYSVPKTPAPTGGDGGTQQSTATADAKRLTLEAKARDGLMAEIRLLETARATLEASTPDYAARLAEVGKCVEKAGNAPTS